MRVLTGPSILCGGRSAESLWVNHWSPAISNGRSAMACAYRVNVPIGTWIALLAVTSVPLKICGGCPFTKMVTV